MKQEMLVVAHSLFLYRTYVYLSLSFWQNLTSLILCRNLTVT